MKYKSDWLNNIDTSSVSKFNFNITDPSSNVISPLNNTTTNSSSPLTDNMILEFWKHIASVDPDSGVTDDKILSFRKKLERLRKEAEEPEIEGGLFPQESSYLPGDTDDILGDFSNWLYGAEAFSGMAPERYTLPRHELWQIAELYPIFVFLIIAIIIAIIILGASIFLAVQKPDTEKLSIYECGFDPYEDSRNKFDVRFYIVAILFIIFDLETVFCFPWIASLGPGDPLGFWAMMDFLLELIVGFAYVWCIGALVWE